MILSRSRLYAQLASPLRKGSALLWQSDRMRLCGRAEPSFCRESPQKGIRSPISGRLASKQKEASGQSVPEMGFSDVILEKDGRRFRTLPIVVLRKNNLKPIEENGFKNDSKPALRDLRS